MGKMKEIWMDIIEEGCPCCGKDLIENCCMECGEVYG